MWPMRDGRYFPLGDKFIPERWTENCPEKVKEKRVFIPFGLYVLPIIVYMTEDRANHYSGPHVCVRKQLSLNEL
jgi:cytochrome P450